MGNFDRFEKLDMLGELNEKYIKEADKYLAEPLLADGEVIRLAPARRKLSWKPFVAAAACAAVLIGGTALMSKYLNSRPITPPVNNASDSSDDSGNSSETDNSDNTSKVDPYLESIREKYNVRDDIKISYLADGWEWTRFEVDGYDDGFYGPMITGRLQDNAALLDDNTMVTVRTLEDGSHEIAAYDLTNKKFSTIFGKDDENGTPGNYDLHYVSDNRIVFSADYYQDEMLYKRELRVADISSKSGMSWQTVPISGFLSYFSNMLIEDNKLYFIMQDPNAQTGEVNGLLYSYDLSSNGGSPELISSKAYLLYSCNSEVFYSTTAGRFNGGMIEPDLQTLHALNGDTVEEEFSSYIIRNAGFFDVSSQKVINRETGGTLFTLPEDARVDGVSDSCITFGNRQSAKPDYFLFDAENNELFMYQNSGLAVNGVGWEWYGFGDSFCIFDEGVNTESTGYILKRRQAQHTAPKPEPEKDKKQQYLDDIRTAYGVSDDVEVVYLRDRLDVVQYSLPWDSVLFAADNGRLFIDSRRAITPSEYVLDKIEMYMLDTKEFVTLISTESDPLADENTWYYVYYANKDLIVFSRRRSSNSDLCVIDLNKEGYPCTTIAQNNDISLNLGSYVTVDGNTLYFVMGVISPGSDTAHDAIYRYELGSSTEPELYVEEGIPLCVCNGDLLYITLTDDAPAFADEIYAYYDYRLIHSKSGTLPMEGEKFGFDMWACKYGIFKLEDNKFIDCLTNKVILSNISDVSITLLQNQSEFGLRLGSFTLGDIYDARTNELLVLEKDDSLRSDSIWESCHWGFCGSYSTGYLICEK